MNFKLQTALSGIVYAILFISCLGGGGTDIGNPNFDSARVPDQTYPLCEPHLFPLCHLS